jgi:hypothetical protein
MWHAWLSSAWPTTTASTTQVKVALTRWQHLPAAGSLHWAVCCESRSSYSEVHFHVTHHGNDAHQACTVDPDVVGIVMHTRYTRCHIQSVPQPYHACQHKLVFSYCIHQSCRMLCFSACSIVCSRWLQFCYFGWSKESLTIGWQLLAIHATGKLLTADHVGYPCQPIQNCRHGFCSR